MKVNRDTIKCLLDNQGLSNNVVQTPQNQQPVVEGRLSFDHLNSGMQIHCCDMVEQQQVTSVAEIPACLSLNILLEGKVNFGLGSRHYHFENDSNLAKSFACVVSQTETFSRRLTRGQKVKKLNISLNKDWLFKRHLTAEEKSFLIALFSAGTHVYSLRTTQTLSELANHLISLDQNKDFVSQLSLEQGCLKVIEQCFNQLIDQQSVSPCAELNNVKFSNKEDDFYRKFETLAQQDYSLEVVAKLLGVSISTLQRKVKKRYQQTAIEFMRYKRLENAKKALVIDDLSIGEVAYGAGYSDVANFATAFKKRFNITPADFRALHIR